MESHRKLFISLSFVPPNPSQMGSLSTPNPTTKKTKTKGMTNIENSLMHDPHHQHHDLREAVKNVLADFAR